MGWTVSVFSFVAFGSAALCAGIGVAVLRERPDPMVWPLVVLMAAGAAWAIPHAISFGYAELDQVLFWNRLIYPGAATVPVAYFVLSLRYAGYDHWLSWPVYVGICVIPVITVGLVWTSPEQGVFWADLTVERVGNSSVLDPALGPWFWVFLAYSYLLIGLSWVVFANVAVSSRPVYRRQALLMLASGVVPTALNAMFNFGVVPGPEIDLTTSALALSGAAFAVALFRYDLFGLSPVAYRNVPDLFGDAVLVFDDDRQLIEANSHAESILDPSLATGTGASDIFDSSLDSLDRTVLTTSGVESRSYSVRYSELHDQRDDVAGHVIVMREITELKEHEQRLSVTNRILRHNLRNELNVILVEAERLDHLLDGETQSERDALARITDAVDRLDDVGEKARHIQSSLAFDEESLVVVDVVPTVKAVVERYRDQYPDADISLESPDSACILAGGNEALETVVRNIVENALEHSDRSEPQIEIGVLTAEEQVTLRVADNGPGIPPDEREILSERVETQLQHGSSLGLWLVTWLVSAMGGDVEFTANGARGTVVTVKFQAGEDAAEGQTVSPPRESNRDG
jgi:signal transduction histidine kinase